MARIYVFLMTVLFSCFAVAQEIVAEIAPEAFFALVFEQIQAFGGLSTMGKIAAVILILLSSMKVSFLRPTWDKLGAAKVWVAPVLGLVYGVLSLGTEITLASAFAYLTAGAGAVLLHELLDSIKALPGIGKVWVSIIEIVKQISGYKKA